MKKIVAFTIAALTLCTAHKTETTEKIVLKPGLLALADGTFFNADLVEMILKYRRGIQDILDGERVKTADRIGKYYFNGKKQSATDLQKEELVSKNKTPQLKKELDLLLEIAKKDLTALSEVFRETARGSQKITAALIQDSCAQRGRTDSLLLIWGAMENPSEQEENKIFEKHVTNFADFTTFATDLYNFLTDLINSCPKAQAQYKVRVQKFNKIKNMLPDILNEKTKNIDKIAFFTHLKKKHLDHLSLEQITQKKISSLVDAFMQPKKTMDDESN